LEGLHPVVADKPTGLEVDSPEGRIAVDDVPESDLDRFKSNDVVSGAAFGDGSAEELGATLRDAL